MNGESSSYDKLESLLQGGSSEPHNVPLKYLRKITNNFSDERLLGKGGFGTVYKGVLQNGETIAVKKFNSSIPEAKDRQFENEANHLMRLKHQNIVLLVGRCSETENIYVEYNGKYICAEKLERLLCLEYMPKGNLRGYLSDEFSGLGWGTRYKIIEGICYGLRYLHEECQINAPIVHMDLKPENILLDNNMVPKIADFGLSRLFEGITSTCTRSRDGTLGYMSPEYINKGLISVKLDIFSLGVIIIEIVTGRRDYPDDTGTSSEEFIEMVLNNWSRRKRVGILFGHVSLELEYQQIRRCMQIGLDCVKIDRFKRPTISQIIQTLGDCSNIKRSEGKGDCEMMMQDQMDSPVADDDSIGGGSPHPHRGAGPPLKKEPWTFAEDAILVDYVKKHGEGNWNAVQKNTGLFRCGKSCRLRWANHLRPNLNMGAFTPEEERLIIQLHAKMGNKWARMAAHLPGRADNEIKNYWNTRIKRCQRAGLPIYPISIIE